MTSRYMTVLVAGLLVAACSPGSKVPGTYIASDQGGSVMVQITAIKDHEIEGTFSAISVDGKGGMSATKRPLSGRLDDGVLNLSIENASGVGLATATTTDDAMKLTIIGNGTSQLIDLKRRPASDFASIENDLRRTAAQNKQDVQEAALRQSRAKTLEAEQVRINNLVSDVTDRITRTADDVGKIDGIIQGYRTMSTRSVRLAALKSDMTAKFGSEDPRLGGIEMATERNADNARSVHGDVIEVTERIKQTIHDRSDQAAVFQAECSTNTALDCSSLNAAMATYGQRVAAFLQAAAREEAAYRGEASKF